MRLIKQGDPEGCGLACVAMVSGKSYAAVRKTYRSIFCTDGSKRIEPLQLVDLKMVMARHGVAIVGRERRFTAQRPRPNGLPFPALLKVNLRKADTEWHWIIWDHRRRRYLDPKVRPYTDRGLKFVSYWQLTQPTQVSA